MRFSQLRHISFYICFFLIFTLSSCTKHLSVQTRYLSEESLASYYVNTPDPNLLHPIAGQRLLIMWNLPKEYEIYEELEVHLKVRWRNHQEERVIIPVKDNLRGYYMYDLVKERYCESGGILTYKVEVVGDGIILDSWIHPLWAKLIILATLDAAFLQLEIDI